MSIPDLRVADGQPDLASPGTTTGPGGLSSPEAAARLDRDGGNVLPSRRPAPLWRRAGSQLRDPLVLVLLAAAGFTLVTADFTDASVILFVVVVNTIVGVVQEVKAERAITALSALTAPDARVVRDGVHHEVPAADLVVGWSELALDLPGGATARQALEALQQAPKKRYSRLRAAVAVFAPGPLDEQSTATRLGRSLRRHRHDVHEGRSLVLAGSGNQGNRWAVRVVSPTSPG